MYTYFNNEKLKTLNNSELSVFNYACHNTKKIIDMTIGELADLTFVSKTTVVRMCQKIGFDGFSEFKYFLKNAKVDVVETVNLELTQKIRANDLSMSLAMIDHDEIISLVEKMKGKKITFFGKGLSNLPCVYATTQFSLMDVEVVSYENTHLANLKGAKMTKDDLLFIISVSGETPQCTHLAKIAKSTDATIVSLTLAGSNTLSDIADIPLYVVASADKRVPFDNHSRIPFMLVIEYILDVYIDLSSQ